MKEIYLIRHTTPEVQQGICYGASDLDVDDNFVKEASEITKSLNGLKPVTTFSSPLKRCSKLASTLFSHADILFDDRLKEMDFGDWEMTPWASIDETVMKNWSSDFVNHHTPNGENFNELYQRASHFMDNTISSLDDNTKTAVVTHSGIMRCLISRYLEIPLLKIFQLKLNYASVVKITLHTNFEEVEFIK